MRLLRLHTLSTDPSSTTHPIHIEIRSHAHVLPPSFTEACDRRETLRRLCSRRIVSPRLASFVVSTWFGKSIVVIPFNVVLLRFDAMIQYCRSLLDLGRRYGRWRKGYRCCRASSHFSITCVCVQQGYHVDLGSEFVHRLPGLLIDLGKL